MARRKGVVSPAHYCLAEDNSRPFDVVTVLFVCLFCLLNVKNARKEEGYVHLIL